MRDLQMTPVESSARLLLDYGVDEETCDGVSISERGMRFVSRWHFTLGTQLAVACEYRHPRWGTSRVNLEGIVVWCERQRQPGQTITCYETTLLFLELPDELRQNLREFSFCVEAAQ